jgi:hypothetical protein
MSADVLGAGDLKRWASISEANLLDELMERGIGDGLPVVKPTQALIDQLILASGREIGSVVGPFHPLPRRATYEEVAICAALAGCRPQHMTIVSAMTTALMDSRLNLLGILTTTGSGALGLIVNGPVRRSAGINSGGNFLGPGTQANAVIGRTLGFITRAICGAVPGLLDMSTMGQPGKYSLCFGENEEESPWRPLHAERGMAPTQSAITVIGVAGTTETYSSHWSSPDDIFQVLAQALATPATVRLDPPEPVVGGGCPLVLLSPEWATYLHEASVTKARLQAELFERATCEWSKLPESVVSAARARLEPGVLGRPLRTAVSPDDIMVVVAGGVGIKQTILPNWPGSRPVTVPVD